MMKGSLFSRRLSQIVAIGLGFVVLPPGLLSPAAMAQEGVSPSTHPTERAGYRPDRDKAAPDSKANASRPTKPEPLSEEESAELATRAQDPGPEVAGGALSNLHLTYIVIALAAAVIVLVLK